MREGTAPTQPWFGILCAGNEKPSVAMETAIPAPSVILCGKLLCRVGRGVVWRATPPAQSVGMQQDRLGGGVCRGW